MAKFPTEVASARTFVFVREIEPLLGAGLIKGGDLDNAIVIYEKEMSQENYDKLADVMGFPTWTPPNWATSTMFPWYGTTNRPATNCWISSATWH